MKPIPYGRQHITEEDIEAVVQVLRSDYLTQGPNIETFEKAFADYVGSKYAIAVANGTAALHLCALGLDVHRGDRVITTPITFSASANCIAYCGGEPVFADIDPDTYLIDIPHVKRLLEQNDHGIKGMVLVDFAGRAVNLEEYRNLAEEHDLWIIEDACHAPGGHFIDKQGAHQRCGNSKFADLAIFSFHPVKHIAAGEGGMVTTNDENLYEKIKALRTHGITKDHTSYTNNVGDVGGEGSGKYPGWYMEMQSLGYNYRLTDFQAALGLSQLQRADQGLERRRQIAMNYWRAFKNDSYIIAQSGFIDGHAYHLYVIEVENRLGLYEHLRKNEIYAQIHYVPVHLMPYYKAKGWKKGDFPNAELYYSRCLSLPMFPTLSDEQQAEVIKVIKAYYE